MRTMFHFYYVLLALLVMGSCGGTSRVSNGGVLNPIDYGVLRAKTGKECYSILYNCHSLAIKNKMNVSYEGIDHLFLEIPQNAAPIPLTNRTDFAGVTIEVLNNVKNAYLFQLTRSLIPINISGNLIDKGDYSGIAKLARGDYLLVIKDETPWVDKRIGYSFGAERRDIMRIHNGKGIRSVVQSYQTQSSSPNCSFYSLNDEPIVFTNVDFIRNGRSSKMTFLVRIENQADVTISNVKVKTPVVGDYYGDAAIAVNNVADLTLKDITIEGTYSQKDKYGYGVSLNNISGLTVERMKGHPNWGVFGNNNINNAVLRNCDINRFDIHCYGKDISFENCIFTGMYNQFSSVYGDVVFKGCSFTEFTPVLIESSYNAFTPFNVKWENCVFNLDKKHSCLITLRGLSATANTRPELKKKYIPSIVIKDCTVNVSPSLDRWSVIETGNVWSPESVNSTTTIDISDLTINGGSPKMQYLSNEKGTTQLIRASTKRIIFRNE